MSSENENLKQFVKAFDEATKNYDPKKDPIRPMQDKIDEFAESLGFNVPARLTKAKPKLSGPA